MSEDQPDATELASEVARLQREIRDVHTQRVAAQRIAATRHTVELALEGAARDRDALSSPELETLRARADDLIDRLRAVWASVDDLRVFAGLIANTGVDLVGDPGIIGGATLMRVFGDEQRRREAADRELAEVGLVGLRVVDAAAAEQPDPRRATPLAKAMDQLLVQRAEADGQARKPRRPRALMRETQLRGPR